MNRYLSCIFPLRASFNYLFSHMYSVQKKRTLECILNGEAVTLNCNKKCPIHMLFAKPEELRAVPAVIQLTSTAECTQGKTGEWLQQVPLSGADIA